MKLPELLAEIERLKGSLSEDDCQVAVYDGDPEFLVVESVVVENGDLVLVVQ